MSSQDLSNSAEKNGQKRHTKRADAIIFMETAEKLKTTPSELSASLGYSANSHNDWIKKGKMPYVAVLACEALIRRHGARLSGLEEATYVVTRIEEQRIVESRMVKKPNTIDINGQRYALIPIKA